MERNIKVANQIKQLTAEYLGRENNRTSLITVISCNTSPDLKKATVFITVLPNSKEHDALDFAKRKRAEIRGYLKKKMNVKVIPFLDIRIDEGEKNRQKIDELLHNS